ncbi:hypothetical protein Scep_004872 [Stephania cephalantha]|uniref:Uncharacterized protein n=1 Tax=Stephania cephalantha TaxID=152367 RepID=A0AAP0KUN0_9MAGN
MMISSAEPARHCGPGGDGKARRRSGCKNARNTSEERETAVSGESRERERDGSDEKRRSGEGGDGIMGDLGVTADE